jgi:hypothetical protein
MVHLLPNGDRNKADRLDLGDTEGVGQAVMGVEGGLARTMQHGGGSARCMRQLPLVQGGILLRRVLHPTRLPDTG